MLFTPPSLPERRVLSEALREETVGGALLLIAALAAVIWANSPWSHVYTDLRAAVIGPSALHLNLTVGVWAADGLLAVFFFVAGLELKRELVVGDLRDPRQAALPVAAAVGGVVTPLTLYLLVTLIAKGDPAGWAVPVATDIAFALAVLAVVGRSLPTALRTFLLTLAIVDDLIAIVIIAVFFTADLDPLLALAAIVPTAVFALLAQHRTIQRHTWSWWLLLPPALLTWGLIHASGIHATVAGVLLALTVPVRSRPAPAEEADAAPGGGGPPERELRGSPDDSPAAPSFAARLEHHLRPLSAGLAVPIFAFLAAGVTVQGVSGLRSALADPAAVGVVAGLVIGKPVGVLGAAWAVARLTRAELDDELGWPDVLGLALLSGIGFTVALLITELAFAGAQPRGDHVVIAVLAGSVLAAVAAAVTLALRDAAHRRAGTARAPSTRSR